MTVFLRPWEANKACYVMLCVLCYLAGDHFFERSGVFAQLWDGAVQQHDGAVCGICVSLLTGK